MIRRTLLALPAVYALGCVAFHQTHIEVWAKDQKAYVIFPQGTVDQVLYYGWRPLCLLDGVATGMRLHIGPHV